MHKKPYRAGSRSGGKVDVAEATRRRRRILQALQDFPEEVGELLRRYTEMPEERLIRISETVRRKMQCKFKITQKQSQFFTIVTYYQVTADMTAEETFERDEIFEEYSG